MVDKEDKVNKNHSFRIMCGPILRAGSIYLDETELRGVTSIKLDASNDEVTKITITMIPEDVDFFIDDVFLNIKAEK